MGERARHEHRKIMANATVGLVVKRQTLPTQPKSEKSEEKDRTGMLSPFLSMWGFFSNPYISYTSTYHTGQGEHESWQVEYQKLWKN